MSAVRRHIAIDLGASSGRVMEVRIGSGELTVRELHRFNNAPVKASRSGSLTMCWPFETMFDSILDGLRIAAVDGDVDSIGVDSWAVDYALLDEEGELVRPIAAYRDPRTQAAYRELREQLGDEFIYRATGIAFQPFNTLYQLATDARDPLRPFERAQYLLMLPDYVAYRLCGAKVCERTNASSTQMLDVHTRNWNEELVAATGAPLRILPRLINAGNAAPLGTLLDEIADETGLSNSTPVMASATHDTASAVIAAPIDPKHDLYISSGTWSLVGAELPAAVLSDEARKANMTNELGAFRSTRFLRNVAGLWLVQQCEAAFEREGRKRSWSELAALASSEPSMTSLINPDDPMFFEAGILAGDMPQRIRAVCGARGEIVPATDGALIRCVLDSIAIASARAAKDAACIASHDARRIVVVGGGSANDLLNQLIANAAGLPVETGPIECTAIGNALVQHAAFEGITSAEPLREMVRNAIPSQRFEPRLEESARMRDATARVCS